MEAENQHPSHYFNLFEGNPSHNNHFNSVYLQNSHGEDFHVQDHVYDPDLYNHHQPSVVMNQEERLRRMVSNRESARRSRMRKRKQIEGLQMQLGQLIASNQFLSSKVINLLECNYQILQENLQLRETVSSFHKYMFYGNHVDLPGKVNDFYLNHQQSPHQPI